MRGVAWLPRKIRGGLAYVKKKKTSQQTDTTDLAEAEAS